jgi:fatty-acyl-CoA synthase
MYDPWEGVFAINEFAYASKRRSPKGTTVSGLLAAQTEVYGDKPALAYLGQKGQSFRDLRHSARLVAGGLLALGVECGEHVAIWAPNLPTYPHIVFGCAAAGMPLVMVNTNYRAYELEYVLRQADVTTLFLADGAGKRGEYLEAIYEICPDLMVAAPGKLKAERLPKLRNVIYLGEANQPGMFAWQDFLAKARDVGQDRINAREATVAPGDIFTIQYTSGTTGVPKGAMLTHANYVLTALAIARRQGLTPQDIICLSLPLFHAYGCMVMITAVAAGATAVIIEMFGARDMLRIIDSCRATFVCGTPTIYVAALEELSNHCYNLSSLRGGDIAGGFCSPELGRAIVEIMGARELVIRYGSTEAPASIMNLPSDPLDRRIGTLGRAMPDTEIRIIDPQTGQRVQEGVPGELCVRGPSVMRGYYGMPEETAKAIDAEGWMHSGDLACVDADGYYCITGRIKDMIIRGGENVYAAEIETFLSTHPKIAEAQVVGIPCPYYGEEVVAFVRLKAGHTASSLELKRFCRAHIALIKVPARFFFVEQFPRTVNGKVQKFKLREKATILLAEEEGKS